MTWIVVAAVVLLVLAGAWLFDHRRAQRSMPHDLSSLSPGGQHASTHKDGAQTSTGWTPPSL